jgi:hypothetical protein
MSDQTAIMSLERINWLVFVTERERVYCAVRAEYLNMIQVYFSVWSVNSRCTNTTNDHYFAICYKNPLIHLKFCEQEKVLQEKKVCGIGHIRLVAERFKSRTFGVVLIIYFMYRVRLCVLRY